MCSYSLFMEKGKTDSLVSDQIKAENVNATAINLELERPKLVSHASENKLKGRQSNGRQLVGRLKQWRRVHLPAQQSLQAARCRARLTKGFDLAGLAG